MLSEDELEIHDLMISARYQRIKVSEGFVEAFYKVFPIELLGGELTNQELQSLEEVYWQFPFKEELEEDYTPEQVAVSQKEFVATVQRLKSVFNKMFEPPPKFLDKLIEQFQYQDFDLLSSQEDKYYLISFRQSFTY